MNCVCTIAESLFIFPRIQKKKKKKEKGERKLKLFDSNKTLYENCVNLTISSTKIELVEN